jgi:four helix bundle protein
MKNKEHKAYKGTVRKAPFEDLWIWQEAHKLMLEVHKIANELPYKEKERAGQAKRSSSSVADNIAEGYGSYYYNDKLKGFYTARKEARETQNHIKAIAAESYITKEKEIEFVSRYEGLVIGINNFIRYIVRKRGNEKKRK